MCNIIGFNVPSLVNNWYKADVQNFIETSSVYWISVFFLLPSSNWLSRSSQIYTPRTIFTSFEIRKMIVKQTKKSAVFLKIFKVTKCWPNAMSKIRIYKKYNCRNLCTALKVHLLCLQNRFPHIFSVKSVPSAVLKVSTGFINTAALTKEKKERVCATPLWRTPPKTWKVTYKDLRLLIRIQGQW